MSTRGDGSGGGSESGGYRGGGYRRAKQHTYRRQAGENWTLTPILDQSLPQDQNRPEPEPEPEPVRTSSSASSTLRPCSEFIPYDQKRPHNRRNHRRAYRAKRKPSKNDQSYTQSDKQERKFDNGHSLEAENELKNDENLRKGKEKVEDDGGVGGECKAEEEVEDIFKRLEELRLGAGESELSEEMLRMNDQAQEDELLALESIYGDNIFILDQQNGLRSFQIQIHIEAPKELTVSARLNSSGPTDNQADNTSEFLCSFKIEYLPPITLTCLFPKSYPSDVAPYFTISVQWLDSSKISDLCHMLDSIWNEQPGQEVIYQWLEWLHSSSLSHLGFDKEIILGPYGVRHSRDRRAISGSVSPEVDIPMLKGYNDKENYKNFCRNFHECYICFSQFSGTEFVKLPCRHYFCWNCMRSYAGIHVKEGTINKLQCPDAKCGGMITPGLLKLLLGEEEFERWEALMLQKTLDSMSDVSYCPRCETACLEDKDHDAQCSKCYYCFCTLCRDRRHVGVQCMTSEMKLLILQERQNLSQLKDGQKRKEMELINELLSVREIQRFAKQCPTCKMAISRTEGCNKMVCYNCGQYFCYRCNQVIDGYDHFRGGQCELFPPEAIQMWEQRMNAHHVVGHIQAGRFGDHGGNPCPSCAQPNVKVANNNHILCWACRNHYCYLCKKTVKRSARHFGPKGCKQHTVG